MFDSTAWERRNGPTGMNISELRRITTRHLDEVTSVEQLRTDPVDGQVRSSPFAHELTFPTALFMTIADRHNMRIHDADAARDAAGVTNHTIDVTSEDYGRRLGRAFVRMARLTLLRRGQREDAPPAT